MEDQQRKKKKRNKLKIILSLLMILSFIVPFGSAFAYDGGLLHGKTMWVANVPTQQTWSTDLVTDGNESTYYKMGAYNSSTNTDTMWYEFSTPKNITSYKFKANNSGETFYIRIYRADGTTTILANNPDRSGVEIPVSGFDNVTKVAIEQRSTGENGTIYEFDVFGTDSSSISKTEVTSINTTNITSNSATVNWTLPTGYTGVTYEGADIYVSGTLKGSVGNTVTSFNLGSLASEYTYSGNVVAKYSDGSTSGISSSNSFQFTTLAELDTTPTGEISNLQAITFTDKIDFTWLNPSDEDFKIVHVYQDSNLIGSSSNGQYSVLSLTPNTSYNFKFVVEDTSGNFTVGTPLTISTISDEDTTPPSAPSGVDVVTMSNGANVTWLRNAENDVMGYNIYVDGVKHNVSPVTVNTYTITGLNVDQTYNIQVSAVDTNENESLRSTSLSITPSKDDLPLFGMDYELKDVADGVGSWFSSIWLIIAFASAIPLSFYIGARVKLLFLD